MNERDMHCMKAALGYAQEALARNEVPIGAVVVDAQGTIIGVGCNMVEHTMSQSDHAEIRAMRAAGSTLQNWRLAGCTLYVTLEPCNMCMGLAALSRIERVVYGAHSPRFGFSLDREEENGIYTREVKFVVGGVCEEEAGALLKRCFALTRGWYGFQSRCNKGKTIRTQAGS